MTDGKVSQFLEDPKGGRVAFVSAVEEHALTEHSTRLFLGNIVQDYVSFIDLDKRNQYQ